MIILGEYFYCKRTHSRLSRILQDPCCFFHVWIARCQQLILLLRGKTRLHQTIDPIWQFCDGVKISRNSCAFLHVQYLLDNMKCDAFLTSSRFRSLAWFSRAVWLVRSAANTRSPKTPPSSPRPRRWPPDGATGIASSPRHCATASSPTDRSMYIVFWKRSFRYNIMLVTSSFRRIPGRRCVVSLV